MQVSVVEHIDSVHARHVHDAYDSTFRAHHDADHDDDHDDHAGDQNDVHHDESMFMTMLITMSMLLVEHAQYDVFL